MVLMSLIVLSLMVVFNSTQTAFRSSLTQTDVLESGRLVMNLMTSDLEAMTPSDSSTVNFYSAVTNFGSYTPAVSPVSPLLQSLTASSQVRTNVLESFFSLSRQHINGSSSWVGTGYTVGTNSPDGALYPLYRFYMTANANNGSPDVLFSNFLYAVTFNTFSTNTTNWSHLMDGVVDLRARAYDTGGNWITNDLNVTNADFTNWVRVSVPYSYTFAPTEPAVFFMYSNVVPAAVEVELGVMEDAILARAEGLPATAQTAYLSNHVGQVHLFRQRVMIRNVDPTAYQ
jgi:hypothetical protein